MNRRSGLRASSSSSFRQAISPTVGRGRQAIRERAQKPARAAAASRWRAGGKKQTQKPVSVGTSTRGGEPRTDRPLTRLLLLPRQPGSGRSQPSQHTRPPPSPRTGSNLGSAHTASSRSLPLPLPAQNPTLLPARSHWLSQPVQQDKGNPHRRPELTSSLRLNPLPKSICKEPAAAEVFTACKGRLFKGGRGEKQPPHTHTHSKISLFSRFRPHQEEMGCLTLRRQDPPLSLLTRLFPPARKLSSSLHKRVGNGALSWCNRSCCSEVM